MHNDVARVFAPVRIEDSVPSEHHVVAVMHHLSVDQALGQVVIHAWDSISHCVGGSVVVRTSHGDWPWAAPRIGADDPAVVAPLETVMKNARQIAFSLLVLTAYLLVLAAP